MNETGNTMNHSAEILPSGERFPFWDDTTHYSKTYHVGRNNPAASDSGPGTAEQPFATINQAAGILLPGEKVVVHAGTYRECVRPARGGNAPDQMIAYEAAPGEEVFVVGSEQLVTGYTPSTGWHVKRKQPGAAVWRAEFPAAWFIGYNPFMANNFTSEYGAFVKNWSKEENEQFLLRRGMVFVDGRPLRQVLRSRELGDEAGVFWVEDPGLAIHFRLWDDAHPVESKTVLEITTREQIFAPSTPGLGYIRVSGFHFRYCADGPPIPQRAMVSAYRGHHWIIENNNIRWANACGIDIGKESWYRAASNPADESVGRHVIRRNTVSDCGICGIAGVDNNAFTLVEDNVIERAATMPIERLWETAGLKFHNCHGVLIRRNVFRNIRHATALWLDFLIVNTRVTQNLVYDVESLHGGIMIEASVEPNWVDHNILWDIRGVEDIYRSTSGVTGPGINIDTAEKCLVAHNLLGNIPDEYAISIHLAQPDRIVGDRTVTGRKNRVLNNILTNCPKRIQLCVAADNESNGNLFDIRDQKASLCVKHPAPAVILSLPAWQEYYRLDCESTQASVSALFDSEKLTMRLALDGKIPGAVPIADLLRERVGRTAGPWDLRNEEREYSLAVGGEPGQSQ